MSADGESDEAGAGVGRGGVESAVREAELKTEVEGEGVSEAGGDAGVLSGAGAGSRAETGVRAEAGTRAEARGDDVSEVDGGARDGVGAAEAEAEAGSGSGSGSEDGVEAVSGAEVEAAGGVEAEAEATVRDAISAPDAEGRPRRTTRRFPLFTRDTARPEGGGRAAPGDAPAPARQWPILTVLSAVALGLLLTALDQFRVGTILIGAALLAGAVMRWMLPSVGMLAVRSRFTDMLTYSVLGIAIVVLALMAQPNPVLVIPFLDDTLHFTVR